jgi:hypothetical protein
MDMKELSSRRIVPQKEDESVTKMRAGKYMVPVRITYEQNGNSKRICFAFRYNLDLMEEIKAMHGARWLGYDETNPRKIWSVLDNQRNRFQIDYLCGKNPYAPYDAPLIEINDFVRPLMNHQKMMTCSGLTRHYAIFAAEPGVGKTLAAIEIMERVDPGYEEIIWVGSRSSLSGVSLEFRKWNSRIRPPLYTYDGLKKYVETAKKAPRMIVFDECHLLKTPTSQRSKAAQHVADAVRDEWGEDGYVIGLTGTPSPKSPLDWYNLCEIVRPGFLREGNINKFRDRLALVKSKENLITGGMYPSIITWFDDERKCAICGEYPDSEGHTDVCAIHSWTASKNEIGLLYKRLKGLVVVQFKKDVLSELPDKIYRTVECKPTKAILRSAELITASSPKAIIALTLLRGLSDGFKYEQTEVGKQTCPLCKGSKTVDASIAPPDPSIFNDEIDFESFIGIAEGDAVGVIDCPCCGGEGEVAKYSRTTTQFPSPKEDALIELLDEYEDVGRTVIYGGFTGTIERIISIVTKQGWQYVKFDGKGLKTSLGVGLKFIDCLEIFQSDDPRKIVFIGQPSAAGEGLTLTKSPVIIYYSNDFNGKSRMQSEERCHRPGMDLNRGCTIVDLVHLPTDQLIINNLRQKKRLQNMSMGELNESLKEEGEREI